MNEILTTVISDFLTPAGTTMTDKAKRRLDRPYGESLTTIEALHKIQEQENRMRKCKKPTAAKGANQRKRLQQNSKKLCKIIDRTLPELGKILEVLVLEYDFRRTRTRTRTRRVSTRIRTHTRGI